MRVSDSHRESLRVQIAEYALRLVVRRCVLEAQDRMICYSVSRESAAQQSRANGVAPMLTPCSIRNKSGDGCEG